MSAETWLNSLDGKIEDPFPSKLHDKSSKVPQDVKKSILEYLKSDGEVILTSSGTEAINHAVKGLAFRYKEPGSILLSQRAPTALRNTVHWLSRKGWKVAKLEHGGEADIVAVEMVDHETGGIIDLKTIREEHPNATLVVEASAAVGRIDFLDQEIDILSIGFDYFGALVLRRGLRIDPLIHGGGEQDGRRGGHLPSILFSEDLFSKSGIQELDKILFKKAIEYGFEINSDRERAPGILNIKLPGISAEAVLVDLASKGIYMSSSSGCTASTGMPSKVLTSMGLTEDEALSSIRISISKENSAEEIIHGLKTLYEIVQRFQS